MNIYSEIARLTSEGQGFVLATVIDSGGSAPQVPGAKLVVLADGSIRGTIGGGAIEHHVIGEARKLLADASRRSLTLHANLGELGMACGGRMSAFLEKIEPAERLLLFGAGHIAQPLVQMARMAGFQLTVADARDNLLTPERFPETERVLEDPVAAAVRLPTHAMSYACVLTHSHELDGRIVSALLRKPLRYLGVIGSRKKGIELRARLKEEGFTDAELGLIRSPIGLSIGAKTPEEIAVSILAELIAVRQGVDASFDKPAGGKPSAGACMGSHA